MSEPSENPLCELCGEPMPPGEEMFKYHGYSGPCPKRRLPRKEPPNIMPDVMADLEHFGETALRIKAERDELARALKDLLAWLDAPPISDHNRRVADYKDAARAALAKVSAP